ncbi:hypothetical protein KH5H1_57730 [Corallococcus caeni]|nr:hypothetical protein KH5H1_57730 [Corallococcus sp. KH5-1]GMU06259.1 hypothetical protein ASNO1_25120 [Corallococcus sp. NO1]
MTLDLGVPPLPLWVHGAARRFAPCGPSFRSAPVSLVEAGAFLFSAVNAVSEAERSASGRTTDCSETVDPSGRLSDNRSGVFRSSPRIRPGDPGMAGTDKRKQSLYFPEEMLKEIQEEANRQDRSLSWVVQQAWKIARDRIKSFPAVNDVTGDERTDPREERP